MKLQWKTMVLVVSVLVFIVSTAMGLEINWAEIGNAGNAPDDTGYGSVGYEYRIATTEVTNAQYIEFLNAVAKTDTYGLYNSDMGSTCGGITQSGSSGNYSYSLKNNDTAWANRPVVYVSVYDAMRFTNWLNNGQPVGSQDVSTTEYGAYDLSLQSTNPNSIVRLSGAQICLPTENEWYKAAYYDPELEVYYDYATGTNTQPNNNAPYNDTGNSANYINGVYTIGPSYYSTEVGAYTLSESPYGTYDQNGNVWEWNETLISEIYRGLRGSSWSGVGSDMLSSYLYALYDPAFEHSHFGFRVASVDPSSEGDIIPEPMSIGLLLLSVSGLVLRRVKRA